MCNLLKRFTGHEQGSVAIIFALSLIPILGASGMAIDYSRLHAGQSALQDAVDGAALAIARYPGKIDDKTADKIAQDYVDMNVHAANVTVKNVTVAMTSASVTVKGSLDLPSSFMSIFGIETMSTDAESEVVWGDTMKYEIALVLDNTGSMEGTKMLALKKAANEFVDLVTARVPDKNALKLAVVPFATFVNVGKGYADAEWIDSKGKSAVSKEIFSAPISRMTLYKALKLDWPGCVETRAAPYDVSDAAPDPADPDTLFVPTFYPDDPDPSLKQPYYANNYIPDLLSFGDGKTRTRNLLKYLVLAILAHFDRVPQTVISNQDGLKGPDLFCDGAPIQPLTNEYSEVRTAINAMVAAGSTNIPEGLMWGWRVLSPTAPFSEGTSYSDEKTKKIIVLLTDGENNFNVVPNDNGGFYTSWGHYWGHRLVDEDAPTFETVQSALDNKTLKACENIKAAGIELFTVRLEEPSVALKGLLTNCATAPSYFADAPSASDLNTVFADIVTTSTNLRIAR